MSGLCKREGEGSSGREGGEGGGGVEWNERTKSGGRGKPEEKRSWKIKRGDQSMATALTHHTTRTKLEHVR